MTIINLIDDSPHHEVPPLNAIELLITSLFSHLQISKKVITIVTVNETKGRQLNRQFRQKNYATNVLSFNSINDEQLGELILTPKVIEQESQQQNKSFANHFSHLIVHGTLHLCGFDHITPEDALVMEAHEIAILSQHGIDNPYLTNSPS